MLLVKDQFTDVNGTLLTAHIIAPMDRTKPSAVWLLPVGSCAIGPANKVSVFSGASRINHAVIETNIYNGIIEFPFVADLTGRQISAIIRYVDENNFWRVNFGPVSSAIVKTEAGVPTIPAQTVIAPALVTGNTYQARVTFSGNDITATIDGGSSVTVSSAFNNTATKHGFRVLTDALFNPGVQTVDDFVFTRFGGNVLRSMLGAGFLFPFIQLEP